MKRLLLLALLTALTLAAADLSGKWAGTLTTDRGVDGHYLTLKQDGNKITGTAGPKDVDWPLRNARLEGQKLTFEVVPPGGSWYLVYELTVGDKELSGTLEGREGPPVKGKVQLKREQ